MLAPRATMGEPVEGGKAELGPSVGSHEAGGRIEPSTVGRAEPGEANSMVRTHAREIEIHAGHVEIEGGFNQLSLSEGVELTVHRYRVTAERLRLERTPQGIVVEGDGRVTFCPCASSPLSVSFSRATVAPPTDLLLQNSTLRICSVPVLWLPTYWVRSPNKLGLMTPRLGWRAEDGPWMGTGVHVPLSRKADGSDGSIELLLGGYLAGGLDLGMQARTPRTTTSVRWDYLQRGMLQLEASGYRHYASQASLTWQVDSLRGLRGRTGPVDFEFATRRYDRFRSELAFSDGRTSYALGAQGDIARATSFNQIGTYGPAARWGIGTAIGQWGRVDSSTLLVGRFRQLEGVHATALHSLDMGFDLRPGPATVRWLLHQRWMLSSGEQRNFDAGLLGSELRIALPMVADFGPASGWYSHWIEPLLLGTAAWRGYAGAYAQDASRPVATAQFGLVNRIGSLAESVAYSLQLRAGTIFETGRREHAMAGRWLASGTWVALGGDTVWGGGKAWLSNVRGRIGRADRVSMRTRLEGRGSEDPEHARWLLDEAWTPWQLAWFSRPGWMTSSDLDFAIGYQVALSTGAAYDVGNRAFVAERAGASYRHPCGCIAASAQTSWRAGRSGWDIFLAFDLMP